MYEETNILSKTKTLHSMEWQMDLEFVYSSREIYFYNGENLNTG